MIPASIYYRPQTKFAKVMLLHLSVILVTGGCLPQCMLGYTPPEQTPRGSRQPPRSRHSLTPQSRHTPQEQTPPPQCMLGDKGNKRAVHILLECILVNHIFFQISKCVSFFVMGLHCPRLIPTLIPIQIPTICRKASLGLIPIVILM